MSDFKSSVGFSYESHENFGKYPYVFHHFFNKGFWITRVDSNLFYDKTEEQRREYSEKTQDESQWKKEK